MSLQFASQAREDYPYWQQANLDILAKINSLLKSACAPPDRGRGQPERLKGNRKGCWSRRITQEYRLVYTVIGEVLHVVECRYHYDD